MRVRTSPPIPRIRLTGLSVRRWDRFDGYGNPLGGPVSLALASQRTVLVGRNGAGKSAFLEGVAGAARMALGRGAAGPDFFEFEMRSSTASLRYEYKQETSSTTPDLPLSLEWTEACARDGAPVWSVAGGTLRLGGSGDVLALPPRIGLLQLDEHASPRQLPEARAIHRILGGIRLLRAGVPRSTEARRPVSLRRASRQSRLWRSTSTDNPRVSALLSTLVRWGDSRPERLDEFRAIGRRLGLLDDLKVRTYAEPGGSGSVRYADIEVDSVNLGLLSDGTLRVCELVRALVDPRVTVMLIEEPETGIHPGLLRGLLNEFDAYAADKQIVLSTHSPVVVDWAHSDEMRVVARNKGLTTIGSVPEAERSRLVEYLEENGSLSEFVFLRSSD